MFMVEKAVISCIPIPIFYFFLNHSTSLLYNHPKPGSFKSPVVCASLLIYVVEQI